MRGIPEENYPAFEKASRELRLAGYEVVSPHESGRQSEKPAQQHYAMLIRAGIRALLDCHGVAVLPGWDESAGARLETDIASGAGMTVAEVGVWVKKGRQPVKWLSAEDPYTQQLGDLEPQRHYEGDAGFDLICAEDTTIGYKKFVDVRCGIAVELPPGVWALIIGRSSTLRQKELMVAPGIIDNGWRGELFAGVWNLGERGTEVARGDRIAQLIPFPLTSAGLYLERHVALGESDRGESGFGSTGP